MVDDEVSSALCAVLVRVNEAGVTTANRIVLRVRIGRTPEMPILNVDRPSTTIRAAGQEAMRNDEDAVERLALGRRTSRRTVDAHEATAIGGSDDEASSEGEA
jgi:hypothetical protein